MRDKVFRPYLDKANYSGFEPKTKMRYLSLVV